VAAEVAQQLSILAVVVYLVAVVELGRSQSAAPISAGQFQLLLVQVVLAAYTAEPVSLVPEASQQLAA
jgi:hypothetical protein